MTRTVWKGPLSSATGGADFSVFMGALFGGCVYLLLARRTVRTEAAAAASDPEPTTASQG